MLLVGFACHVSAQTQTIQMQLSSGTGFYVNAQGYVITNAHVVPGCKTLALHGGKTQPVAATIIAKDEEHDLAILKIATAPPAFAQFRRDDEPMRAGEPLLLAGFPGNDGAQGKITLRVAKLLFAHGPQGEAGLLQFTESAAKGNSGGPLVDSAGRVVGVVLGKSTVTTINKTTGETINTQHSDVAISLATLNNFLQLQGIPTTASIYNQERSAQSIADEANTYIVNVLCRVS